MNLIKSFILVSVLFFVSCSKDLSPLDNENNVTMRPLTDQEKVLVEADKSFGLKLFKAVSQKDANKDVFISPLSISMALGMTLNGADSATYEAMIQTLEFSGLSNDEINGAYLSLIELLLNLDDKVLFEIANSIWYRDDFSVEQLFIKTNQTYFDATILPRDFTDPATITAINDWVAEKTHYKITEIIDQIDPLTVMFLINALYFKGTWTYEFDKKLTTEAPFFTPDGSQHNCQLMQITSDFEYYQDERVQIIDLPYGNGQFSMTILLPRRDIDLSTFISTLEESRWTEYLGSLRKAEVLLETPKFKMEYKIKLNDVLSAMGMSVAFDPGRANFSRINPDVQLFISQVLHKTFVQVDEEGTEAAAVTVVEVGYTSVDPPDGYYMRVDRPFMFVLRERQSGTLLFMGKVSQPQWSE